MLKHSFLFTLLALASVGFAEEAKPNIMFILADDCTYRDLPEFKSIKNELSTTLDAWMEAQGDKGWETELLAKERTKKLSAKWSAIKKQERENAK